MRRPEFVGPVPAEGAMPINGQKLQDLNQISKNFEPAEFDAAGSLKACRRIQARRAGLRRRPNGHILHAFGEDLAVCGAAAGDVFRQAKMSYLTIGERCVLE